MQVCAEVHGCAEAQMHRFTYALACIAVMYKRADAHMHGEALGRADSQCLFAGTQTAQMH